MTQIVSKEMRTPLALATRARSRARGLLMAESNDEALLLVPCRDVHTFGMRRPIDIAFVNRGGFIVEAHRAVQPMKRLRNRKAVAVIERFSPGSAPWFSVGDRLQVFGERGEE